MKFLLLLTLSTLSFAQSNFSNYKYAVGSGAGLLSPSAPQATTSTIGMINITGSTYSFTALETALSLNVNGKLVSAGVTSLRTGVLQVLAAQGNTQLVGIAAAGFAGGNTSFGNAFDGGFGIHYNFKNYFTFATHFMVDKTSQTNPKGAIYFYLLKTFE